jgi:SAM-dependent methyltransferase
VLNSTKRSEGYSCVADAVVPLKLVHSFEQRGNPSARYDVWECERTGFQFVHPMPSREQLAAHYQQNLQKQYQNYVRARELKKEYFRRHFERVLSHCGSPGRMLDVGCAAGFALEVAEELGFEAFGVEINPGFNEYSAPRLRDRITYGTLDDLSDAEPFDLITMFDVLEHSPNPRKDIETVRDLLTDHGHVAIQIPCLDSAGARLMGRRWYHYAPPSHLSYFTLDTFTQLAQSVGFRVVSHRWTRKLMTIDYLAAQLSDKYLPVRFRIKKVPGIGSFYLEVPMSERAILLARE